MLGCLCLFICARVGSDHVLHLAVSQYTFFCSYRESTWLAAVSCVLILAVIGISQHGHESVNTLACCTLSRLGEVKSAADELRITSDEENKLAHKVSQKCA